MRTVCSSPTRFIAYAALLVPLACSTTSDDAVSFKTEIAPLLERRCVLCHYDGGGLSLQHPFVPEDGLFVVENTHAEGHDVLQHNVVPYDPDASFLLQKVTDPELVPENSTCDPTVPVPRDQECPISRAGLFMPPRPLLATENQIEIVRNWIQAGAEDTPDFRNKVVPIFGEAGFNGRSCAKGGYADFCVPCFTCHYEKAPTTPNLVVPDFRDPGNARTEELNQKVAQWLQTIVGVKSHFRADLDLVAPGNPDASFLLMKLEAREPTSAVGAPMPYRFEPLSDVQVGLLRQWILEGARDN